jgi:protein CpxP
MRTTKLSLIAALALGGLLACTSGVSAQDNKEGTDKAPGKKGRGMTVEAQMERLTTELKLTDEQKPKIEKVVKENTKKMQDLRTETTDQTERREKARGLMEERDKEFKKILTAEQYTKWEKLREEMRQRGGKGGGGGGGGASKSETPKQ